MTDQPEARPNHNIDKGAIAYHAPSSCGLASRAIGRDGFNALSRLFVVPQQNHPHIQPPKRAG